MPKKEWMQSLPNGTTLGEYALIRLIGRGGMGEVYEAYQAKLHRRVALKLIAPLQPDDHDYEDLFRRFLQEARTLAQVNHPNIVTIYDIDRIGGAQFIAMEYVNGLSLKQLLKEIKFSLDEAVPIFAQMLDGLACLHDNHILHRDLKPHNILLRVDGQVKILDFGIAKQTLPGAGEGTQIGVIAGTLPYMAPEVKMGDPATPSSDVYSLGAIFYELLVGRPLSRVMLDSPDGTNVPWSLEDQAKIPQGMRNLINNMCAHNLKDRYQRTPEVIEELKRFRQNRPAVSADVYDALVKRVAEINSQKRKETTCEYSIASLKNSHSPLVSNLKLPKEERRRLRRKARQQKRDLLSIVAGVAGLVLVLGTWFGFRKTSHTAPIPIIQPIVATSPAKENLLPPLVLTEPKDKATLWLEPSRIPTLWWSRPIGTDEYEIQISTDLQFNKILVSETVAGNNYRPAIMLPEGRYYWRLESQHGQAPVAGPFSFTIAYIESLKLISPNSQRVFEASGDSTSVDFSWKCKAGNHFYRIQIADNFEFRSVVKEQVVKTCRYKTGQVPAGNFYWRVRAESDNPSQALWSEVRNFIVREGTPAPSPAPAPAPARAPVVARSIERSHPKTNKPLTTVTLSSSNSRVTLDWNPLKEARSYQVQMSMNKDFTKLITDERTTASRFEWKSPEPGKIFWRVRGLDHAGNFSDFSPRAMVIVLLPAPKIKNSFKFTKGKKEVPVVEWDRLPGVNKYLVKLGRTRNLASEDEQLVNEPKLQVSQPPGHYYLRIAAANASGDALSAYSQPSTIVIEGVNLGRPVTQSPGMGARAPSREGRLSAKFSWTPVPNADIYSVELAMDSDFSQIIQKLRTPQSVFFLKQAQLRGRVYWRVRAENAQGNSEWSAPSYFDVR